MKFYIKERHNPQFDQPYYVCCGKLSKKDAAKKESSIYGFNVMLSYNSEKEYHAAIAQFEKDGMQVQNKPDTSINDNLQINEKP